MIKLKIHLFCDLSTIFSFVKYFQKELAFRNEIDYNFIRA